MKIAASKFGVLMVRDGLLIWDDVLNHKQIPINNSDLPLLGIFKRVREVNDELLIELARHDIGMYRVQQFLQLQILLDITSERYSRELDYLTTWSGWGSLARLFNFSTRTNRETRVLTVEEDRKRLAEKIEILPPPERFWSLESIEDSVAKVVSLPRVETINEVSFIEILESRRSIRSFSVNAVSLKIFSEFLKYCAGVSESRIRTEDDIFSGNYFRAAASGGGRASTELYVYVRNVDGLMPGSYRYLPESNALEWCSSSVSDDFLLEAVSGQKWMLNAAFIIFLTGNVAALKWKYQTARSYRCLFLDAGHMAQVIQMCAAALNLGSCFSLMQRDEMWEEMMGVDPALEVAMGIIPCGFPEFND